MATCVGCGLTVNETGVLIVERNPDTTASGLECTDADGLSLNINHTDGTCVTTTGLGTAGSPLHAEINLADSSSGLACDGSGLRVVESADAYNGLDVRANGVFARCPSSLVYHSAVLGYAGASFPVLMDAVGSAHDYSVVNFGGPFTVTNPLPWTVEGFWEFRAYGGWVSAINGFDGYAYLSSSIDGGAFNTAIPNTNFRMDNRGSGRTVVYEPSGMVEKNYIAFAPGQSYTFELRLTIHVTAGAASSSWLDTANGGSDPTFEFYLHCTQTGSC